MSLLSSPLAARDCTDSELVARLPGLVVSSLYRYCIDRRDDEDAALKVGTHSGTGGASRTTCSGAGKGAQGRLEPLSPSRVRVEFTARAELYEKLEKARDLLSHALPSGELGELFERALDALLERETRKRFGAPSRRATRKRSRAKAPHEARETSKRFGAQTPHETSRRSGAEAPRNAPEARKREPRSRQVPVRVARAVWQRDGSQCTHVDAEGRRCGERRFLTIEHRTPFALGGPHTPDNLCLLCAAHNLASARRVFGDSLIEARIRTRAQQQEPAPPRHDRAAAQPPPLDLHAAAKLQAALCQLGFRRSDAAAAVGHALGDGGAVDVEQLLRECLLLLVPAAS